MNFKISLIFTSLFLLLLSCSHLPQAPQVPLNAPENLNKPFVLLVSMDAFRYDYVDRFKPHNIMNFRDQGSSVASLRPIFPSKTFPNHLAIITGLYAENHGIVSNDFFNPELNKRYKLSDPSAVRDARFYGGTPLWVAAHKQQMVSASYFWPGSEAPIQGIHPDYYKNYDDNIPNRERINQVISWFELPLEQRPHLVTLYFSDVDEAGHEYGTESEELKKAVDKLDEDFGYLLEKAKTLSPAIDIILLSDHGMQNLDPKKVEFIDDYINMDGIKMHGGGPHALLYIEDKGKIEDIYQKLKKSAKHFRVYKKSDVPSQFHYFQHPAIGDLIIESELPYSVILHSQSKKSEIATHGFDPYRNKSMHGILYVNGPHLCKGIKLDSTDNINVYPLVIKVLGLKSEHYGDGTIQALDPLSCPSK